MNRIVRTLTLSLLGLVGALTGWAQSTLSSEQSSAAAGYVVVDRHGKSIGTVISTNQGGGYATVIIQVGRKSFTVALLRTQFLNGSAYLYYSSPDCTGQPYGDASFTSFSASYYSPNTSTMLYGESGQPVSAQFNSYFDGYVCNTGQYSTNYAVPMSPVLDLSQFTPPFVAVESGKNQR